MMPDRVALDAAAARSAHVAATFADHPTNRRLRDMFAGDDAGHLAVAAERLLTEDDWLADLLTPMIAEMRAEPLLEPPLEAQRDAVRCGSAQYCSRSRR